MVLPCSQFYAPEAQKAELDQSLFRKSQVVEINWKNPSHEDEKDPEAEKLSQMRVDVEKRIL